MKEKKIIIAMCILVLAATIVVVLYNLHGDSIKGNESRKIYAEMQTMQEAANISNVTILITNEKGNISDISINISYIEAVIKNLQFDTRSEEIDVVYSFYKTINNTNKTKYVISLYEEIPSSTFSTYFKVAWTNQSKNTFSPDTLQITYKNKPIKIKEILL